MSFSRPHYKKLMCALIIICSLPCTAQENSIMVTTLSELNASGGVTADPSGSIYISDFGKQLGAFDSLTNVYQWNKKSGEITVFASGFKGASGSCFDMKGNFYQSNPFGHSISKLSTNGTVNHNWCTSGMTTPVGLEADREGNIYVSNCGQNEIGKISPDGQYTSFAKSDLFRCPNGLTQDDHGNLYACNFSNGDVLKISPKGLVSVLVTLPVLTGGPNPVGNGHVVFSKGWLYVTTIGLGEIYRVSLDGQPERIAGKAGAFKNTDGNVTQATFNKPNGIAASTSGDTLFINVSTPTWINNPRGLHPAKVVMITGICSLPNAGCSN